jgi:hypothetical protein
MRLSLLPTGPPPVFQHWWVRSSTARYGRFNLPMGRSPGFASIAPDMRPIQTRFPWGSPPEAVNRAGYDNSPDHYAKGTRSRGPEGRCAPTACRHGVSGSVSSPGRGSSHRSVALLGSLSVVIECLALRDGPRRFRPGFTCPTLLGYQLGEFPVHLRAFTRSGAVFQTASVPIHSSLDCWPHDPGEIDPPV